MEVRPNVVYQYFSCDNGINFLKSNALVLKMSSPIELNDPFEFLPETNLFSINHLKNVRQLNSFINKLDKLYLKNELDISDQTMLLILKQYKEFVHLFKISCFSELSDSILMWGHYAKKHSGMVIGFDSNVTYWGEQLKKVKYSDKRIQIPTEIDENNNKCNILNGWQSKLIYTKANCWKYESEWRYYDFTERCRKIKVINNGHYETFFVKDLKPDCIKEVILGFRMEDSNKRDVQNLISAKYSHVHLYQAKINNINYSIDFIPNRFNQARIQEIICNELRTIKGKPDCYLFDIPDKVLNEIHSNWQLNLDKDEKIIFVFYKMNFFSKFNFSSLLYLTDKGINIISEKSNYFLYSNIENIEITNNKLIILGAESEIASMKTSVNDEISKCLKKIIKDLKSI